MIDKLSAISDFCRLDVHEAHKVPVAIVGAGSIVDAAHLPAYAMSGIEVRGITDLRLDRARYVAKRHRVPHVYADLDELLADDEVQVVDVAVHSNIQPEIARAVFTADKHLLAQKPFAPDATSAEHLCRLAEEHGLHIAVNQQLRFDEGIAATKRMLELGWVGSPTVFSLHVNIKTDWSTWPWMATSPRLEILYHSIHYFDAIRWLFSEPTRVYCVGGRTPGQIAVGETRTISTLTFPNGMHAIVTVNHENRAGDNSAVFRVDGDKGAIRGTLGLLYDYPNGRPDTLEVTSAVLPTDGWMQYPVTSRWLPDAFQGPMASLLQAIATGQPARSSGRDNVGTLQLVESLYRSQDTGEVQKL